jgi:hypothetical protein
MFSGFYPLPTVPAVITRRVVLVREEQCVDVVVFVSAGEFKALLLVS